MPMPMTREAITRRFLALVAVMPSGCWEWQGERRRKPCLPYGIVRVRVSGNVVQMQAHRRAYELFVGPIPESLFVLHSCDNPPCVNPAHLRPGTALDNGSDMRERRRAHFADAPACVKGHEFTPENTYFSLQRGLVRRHCKTCRRAAWRKYHNAGRAGQQSLRIA